MLTIKSDPTNWKNIIELNKASLCTLLKNTKLEYLTKINQNIFFKFLHFTIVSFRKPSIFLNECTNSL